MKTREDLSQGFNTLLISLQEAFVARVGAELGPEQVKLFRMVYYMGFEKGMNELIELSRPGGLDPESQVDQLKVILKFVEEELKRR